MREFGKGGKKFICHYGFLRAGQDRAKMGCIGCPILLVHNLKRHCEISFSWTHMQFTFFNVPISGRIMKEIHATFYIILCKP